MQIRYDRLVADIDRALVYDNVPPAERESDYRYWRAVSLARLALELSNGNDMLTLDGMPVHFTRHYADARRTAQLIARGQWTYQTRGREEELAAMINHEFRPEQQLQPSLIYCASAISRCNETRLYGNAWLCAYRRTHDRYRPVLSRVPGRLLSDRFKQYQE